VRAAGFKPVFGLGARVSTIDPTDLPFLPPPPRIIDHWCRRCGTHFQSPHPRHFYCEPCSESQDLKRKRLDRVKVSHSRQRDRGRDKGKEISAQHALTLADGLEAPVLGWYVRFAVPFSYSASKNAIYALRRKGHVALRREAREYRDAITLAARSALRDRTIVRHKLWIDLFVEKADHKGDAVNVVDTVCDAIKVAIDLDDRWFCIRRVDWSVNKYEPQILIGISQELGAIDSQVCSYCGRILPFSAFSKNVGNLHGISRTCRECKRT
jgi:hypothetical protein